MVVCVEAMSSMRRNSKVAPKYLLRSLVIRHKRESLERVPETKDGGKRKERTESRESDHYGLHHHLIITEQCP